MGELKFSSTNHATAQFLCELEVWAPPQGSTADIAPFSVDLRFSSEEIETSTVKLIVFARQATLVARLRNAEVVRGSKYGDHIHDPYLAAELIEHANSLIENTTEFSGDAQVEVKRALFGNFFASLTFRKNKRKRKLAEVDNIVKVSYGLHRVISRPKNRWKICEPRPPYRLEGKYLGENLSSIAGDKTDPLFLFSTTSTPASVSAEVYISEKDIDVSVAEGVGKAKISQNKAAIIAILAKRSVLNSVVSQQALREKTSSEEICLQLGSVDVIYENR